MPSSVWIALFLGTAGVFADMYTTQAILPVLGRAFDLPPATAGLTVSAVVLAVAAGSLIAGPLSDRIGRKPVIVGASALLVVPTLLCGLAPTFGLLVAFRALQGLLMPGLTSVMIVYVNERFAVRWRGTAMGIYVGGQVLGGLLARGASATLTALFDWRRALMFFALPTAGGALALGLYLPKAPCPHHGHQDARWLDRPFPQEPRGPSLWDDVATHLRNGRLLATCAIGFALFFGFIGTFTYVPYYLTAAPFCVPQGSLGLVYLVWATGIFSPVAGALAGRMGRLRTIAGSLGLACLGMLLTLIPSLPVIVLGLGLLALGMFTAIPGVNLLIGEVTTVARGTASALYLCCYYIGGSIGAVAPGLAWQHFAWPGVIMLCLCLALAALAADGAMARSAHRASAQRAGT
jgi:MFS transporter, YNFM family, putative membrane transport protein